MPQGRQWLQQRQVAFGAATQHRNAKCTFATWMYPHFVPHAASSATGAEASCGISWLCDTIRRHRQAR